MSALCALCCFFFFNDTATTEIYTLSLHDALPIWRGKRPDRTRDRAAEPARPRRAFEELRSRGDRKSTRLNSSHLGISYAVFCLKKKKKILTFNDRQRFLTQLRRSGELDAQLSYGI